MSQAREPAVLILKSIEVGGIGLPVLYREYRVGSFIVSLRYSEEPFLILNCMEPYQGANVVAPESTPKVTIDDLELYPWEKGKRYRLAGTTIDKTVEYITSATTVEEIKTLLTPLIEWVIANSRIVPQ